jgi:FHA domain
VAGEPKRENAARKARHTNAESDTAPVERLIALGGDGPRQFSLRKKRIAVGSGRDNDLVLAHLTVSRHHAVIRRRFGRVRVADLESTNGTFINRKRIAGPQTLKRGDELRFGAVRFAFHEPGGRRRRRPLRLLVAIGTLAAVFAAGFIAAWYKGDELLARLVPHPANTEVRPATAVSRPIASAPRALSSSAPASRASAATVTARTEVAKSAERAGAGPSAAEPAWLARLNYYRAMVGLRPVTEDPRLSAADRAHTSYLVNNFPDVIRHGGLGALAHTEDPARPGYTPEGLAAATGSDTFEWYTPPLPPKTIGGHRVIVVTAPFGPVPASVAEAPRQNIDSWMSIVFHRPPILSPLLERAGYGLFCESGACAAALDLLHGARTAPFTGLAAPHPIEFPPNGSQVTLKESYAEWPDPLTSCAGYALPAGLAITLQLGEFLPAKLDEFSIGLVGADGNATPIEACGFDAGSYANPDPGSQERGRGILHGYAMVAVIPRRPLHPGAKYAVAMTVNGKKYDWSFSVAPTP